MLFRFAERREMLYGNAVTTCVILASALFGRLEPTPFAVLHFSTQGAPMSDCLFCKIIAGEIPSKKVYEDEHVYAFEDIKPAAPTHILIIPKRHFAGLKEATADDAEIIGYCNLVAARLGRERNIEDGYRTVLNVGPRSGQSVFHLHLHLLGGRDMAWPPG